MARLEPCIHLHCAWQQALAAFSGEAVPSSAGKSNFLTAANRVTQAWGPCIGPQVHGGCPLCPDANSSTDLDAAAVVPTLLL